MEKYLLTKEEIESMQGLVKTHYLNDQARRINKSLGDATGLSGFGIHLIEVQPGFESTELHCHHHEDECVYILEGEALATLGDETFAVGPGDFIGYRAGGLAHSLKNSGEVVLRCLVVGQRLDHDVADYPRLNKRLFRNKDLPWNLVDLNAIEEPQAGKKT
ncbi:cupin domain-containing protein [Bowmanella dokdonensis]|uniref:Cupin domain-containing protein n=1 Tax=Bowmanella dokdonensis TaxID=751969 RepID=A0A939DP64_9ALTE|nr:cupin domain-containing protein [Bowmanella dokdonensis]MBN7825386.1 cupin domain-containing protein [Bowmanella dokdonensis]